MYRRLACAPLVASSRNLARASRVNTVSLRRTITTSDVDARKEKYMEKLRQKAQETGLSVSELLEKAKQEEADRRKAEAEKLKAAAAKFQKPVNTQATEGKSASGSAPPPSPTVTERKDAAPYKALGSILNLSKLLATPHTAEQISALWTAYHASRSGGTGRGFVCASIPLDQFDKLRKTGQRYPTFVVPLPRVQEGEDASAPQETAHEFYFLQWDFHAPPAVPSGTDDPFVAPTPSSAEGPNPPTATVLFTPLQEYKQRGSFATPYLVLTMYTDLVATHGLVLLRGEITPSQAAADRFMLSQEDAQALTMSLQKFYLWSTDGVSEGERFLRAFHETPEEFKWEELIEFAKLTA